MLCPRCGETWSAETTECPSCGADLTGETVLNNVHEAALGGDTERHVGRGAAPITSGSLTVVDGRISSGQITAESPRLVESATPPTAQPGSDPTTSTKLDPGFVHLVPGTLVGEYEIEKLLGSGGMGAVYGARHERLRKKVAVKVIAPSLSADQSAVERFEQEALALAQLSHPNIVAVLSIGTLPGDGRGYYVMEWLDGESLHDRLGRGRVPLGEALDVLDQIARGLDAAHAAGIVHRDLKPDNCWLQQVRGEPRRIVKILDFGLSKLAEHRRSQETAVNVMFGTPSYMSPEQCRSTRDVGPETDVYAFGCIGYELLCGRLPFTYDNAAELVVAHGSETPPTPRSLDPAIPSALDALLTGMLAKEPSHRPTLAQVRRTVATALAGPASTPRPRSPARTARTTPEEAQTRSAPVVPAERHASRRVFAVLAGVTVLSAITTAAIVGSGGASLGEPQRVTEEPRRAVEIDASVAPSIEVDASVPLATPTPRVDTSTAAPRSNASPDAPAIARPPRAAQASAPADVVEPDPKPAADTTTIDAGVEPGDGGAVIDLGAPPRSTATGPSPHRAPPVPAAKKLPNRDVIVNPFKKKQGTR